MNLRRQMGDAPDKPITLREGFKKFGWLCDTFYLCTPFAKTGKTVEFERRVGQSVKTPPFHGGMRGSTPLRGTNI
jgi:hypothetical protein